MKMRPALPQDTLLRWLGEVPIYVIATLLFALCTVILTNKGVAFDVAPVLANAKLFAFSVAAVMSVAATRELIRTQPVHPFNHLRRLALRYHTQIVAGVPLLALLIMLLPFFSKMKAAIPLFTTYSWDVRFIAWDRMLFGGYDAWQILQPIFGYPIVTAALGLLYQAWFLLLFVGTLWIAFAKRAGAIRRQFFLTYVLCWTLIGGAMATWLASVGPCFAKPLLGNRTFDAQMAYLNAANEQIPVMPLKVQQMLLDWHMTDADGLGSGITAMPSMHVAICVLFWLALRRVSRVWGRAFFAFFVTIWIGSVHLAYHYAVDGLVSLIAVIALWKLSSAFLAGWDAWSARLAHATFRTKTVPAE